MGHKNPLPTKGAARQVSHHPARSSDGPDPVYLSSKKAGATGFFAAEAPPPATARQVPLTPTRRRPNPAAALSVSASRAAPAPALCP